MGIYSSIEIKPCAAVDPVTLLTMLLEAGWRYNPYGTICYLPSGDEEMYDWQFVSDDKWEDVEKICYLKAAQGETIGIVLTWKDTMQGGNFLIYPEGKIEISPARNRVLLSDNLPYTDFSWYLSKILFPLIEKQVNIETVQCIDSYA